jgi:hypothetical protein
MSAPTDTPPLHQQLRGLADQIRVKIHLAGMDARDSWNRLEPRLNDYERKAERATEKVASNLAKLGRQLKQELTTLRDDLTRADR